MQIACYWETLKYGKSKTRQNWMAQSTSLLNQLMSVLFPRSLSVYFFVVVVVVVVVVLSRPMCFMIAI